MSDSTNMRKIYREKKFFKMALNKNQLLLLLLLYKRRKKKRLMKYKKRFWVREVFQEREDKGEFHCLVKELMLVDRELFFKMFRLMPTQFEKLLALVAPKITKANTRVGVISPAERLCVTLRYLATGDGYVSIAASYRIGHTTISRIVEETTCAIWDSLLKEGYLKVPQNANEWKQIADVFEKKWNFPNCVGAIDGKHVQIVAPPSSGSLYFNYKKMFSIVLLAVCNADYQFTLVDVGEAGRQSDGGVFANSNIGYCITKDIFQLPCPRALDTSGTVFPYVFVADDAFPLRHNMIKPYAETNLDIRKLVANYRISRARRVIENAFGILAARFRVFRRPIHAKVETTESITKACVALHNFLMVGRQYGTEHYCPARFADYEIDGKKLDGEWRSIVHGDTSFAPVKNVGSNNYGKKAKDVRDSFATHFCTPVGEVPWQWQMYAVDVNR